MPKYLIERAQPSQVWFGHLFDRCAREGLLESFNASMNVTMERWLEVLQLPDTLTLNGYVDGDEAGFLVGRPFGLGPTQCMEVAVCAFRAFFREAAPLSRRAYLWCFDNLDCVSLLGRVIDTNRHVLRMAPHVGFSDMGSVPGLFWSDRRQCFRAGHIMLATRESVMAAIDKEE